MEQINNTNVQRPMENHVHQNKNSLWILFAAGIFLCVVIGAALILWRPSVKDPVISSVNQPVQTQSLDTWMNPTTTSDFETTTAFANTENAFNNSEAVSSSITSTTIDLNALSAANDLTTVRDDTAVASSSIAAPEVPATVTKPVIIEKETPVVTKKPAVAATPKKTQTVTEYWIQTGSFSSREYAENAQDIIASYKIDSEIFTKEVNGKTWYRVRMGPYRTKTEADYWKTAISSDDVNFKDAYITEVKTQK
ncbi:MAG: SPOR domain-containing protein [Treponema sp.]|jgi:cell division protein FtsN|nr:SPOR domain-containing protein [Treponema sp.]